MEYLTIEIDNRDRKIIEWIKKHEQEISPVYAPFTDTDAIRWALFTFYVSNHTVAELEALKDD